MTNSLSRYDQQAVFEGIRKATALTANEVGASDKPRASGLSGDARSIALSMAGAEPDPTYFTDPARSDLVLTQEVGREVEDLTVLGLEEAYGVSVGDRQLCIGHKCHEHSLAAAPYFYVTGHPDGIIYDGEERLLFEHKHLGWRTYTKVLQNQPIHMGYPDLVAQSLLYADALGLKTVVACIVAADASAVRHLMYNQKPNPLRSAKQPWANQKMLIIEFSVDLYRAWTQALETRARWFSRWYANCGNPMHVQPEARLDRRSHTQFPWGWDEYRHRIDSEITRAAAVGLHVAPPMPYTDDWKMDVDTQREHAAFARTMLVDDTCGWEGEWA